MKGHYHFIKGIYNSLAVFYKSMTGNYNFIGGIFRYIEGFYATTKGIQMILTPSHRFQAYSQLAQFQRYTKSCKQAFKPLPPE